MSESTAEVVRKLRQFLNEVDLLCMATVDDEGHPHAINAYFVCDDALNLYFISHPESAHSVHIRKRPQVAVAAYGSLKMWQQVRGVQLHGQCRELGEDVFDATWRMFIKRFPGHTEIENHARAARFYCISPNWIRWSDNSVHFGYKVELNWPPPDVIDEAGRGKSIV